MRSSLTELNLSSKRIGFLGAGSIVEAMLAGITKQGIIPAEQITITNRSNDDRLAELCNQYHVRANRDQQQIFEQSDILILAMKPKDVAEACLSPEYKVKPDQLVISLIAGVSTDCIGRWLSVDCPIIRTMPNTSSAIGLSATGIAKGRFATDTHLSLATRLFESIGRVYAVPESELDIITGLSGSGPAYVYYLVEAMEAAGIKAGLTPEMSRELILQTMIGAANMLIHTKEEPSVLRRKITSPGGTTQAALEVLESYHFQEAVTTAILRATERSKEMGAQFQ